MFCGNCGKPIEEEAKFCSNCGTLIQPATAAMPELALEKPEMAREPSATIAEEDFGALLDSFKSMSKYIGTPVIGNSVASGTLLVYESALKFVPKWGSSLHGSGGLVRAIAAVAVDLIDSTTDNGIYLLEQISELKIGKYMGVYNTLVVSMKSGDIWSFCPPMPGSSIPKLIIALLKPYI